MATDPHARAVAEALLVDAADDDVEDDDEDASSVLGMTIECERNHLHHHLTLAARCPDYEEMALTAVDDSFEYDFDHPHHSSSSWFGMLWEGGLLYGACLVLPTVLSAIISGYDDMTAQWNNRWSIVQAILQSMRMLHNHHQNNIVIDYICRFRDRYEDDDNQNHPFWWVGMEYISNYAHSRGWCPIPDPPMEILRPVISKDVEHWKQDFCNLMVLSLLLTILRIVLSIQTNHIIPQTAPKQEDLSDKMETVTNMDNLDEKANSKTNRYLQVLVRCKSSSLLSNLEEEQRHIKASNHRKNHSQQPPRQSRLATEERQRVLQRSASVPLQPKQSKKKHSHSTSMHKNRGQQQRQDSFMSDASSTGVKSETMSRSWPRRNHTTSGSNYEEDLLSSMAASSSSTSGVLFHHSPLLATALFRWLCASAGTIQAWVLFRDADFWPPAVGGHGHTARCWDLSGGLSLLGIDSDYDQQNASLKRFFLFQGSYHLHSLLFHVVTVTLILVVYRNDHHAIEESFLDHHRRRRRPRWFRFRTSTSSYFRSMGQHLLALFLIAVAYVFASLRRLSAIGMFAFDVSSWCWHSWQICRCFRSASTQSSLGWKIVEGLVFWICVIPSFVLTRFWIWPLLWYSAIFESQSWLKQFEQTLWPGSATIFRSLCHICMSLLLAFSLVCLTRLLSITTLRMMPTNRLPPRRSSANVG
jgi:hypothetical protein